MYKKPKKTFISINTVEKNHKNVVFTVSARLSFLNLKVNWCNTCLRKVSEEEENVPHLFQSMSTATLIASLHPVLNWQCDEAVPKLYFFQPNLHCVWYINQWMNQAVQFIFKQNVNIFDEYILIYIFWFT